MESKKLEQYWGRLSPQKVCQGINYAISNAKRLVEDAESLIKNERYPSAVGLAILAMEEIGKLPILRRLAITGNAKEQSQLWKEYRTHTKKNLIGGLPKIVFDGAHALEDVLVAFSKYSDIYAYAVENIKQLSIYTDCLGDDGHWAIPANSIAKELAERCVVSARAIIPDYESTEKEMEIWIKHIGSVDVNDIAKYKAAFERFVLEMLGLGLCTERLEKAYEFVMGKKLSKH